MTPTFRILRNKWKVIHLLLTSEKYSKTTFENCRSMGFSFDYWMKRSARTSCSVHIRFEGSETPQELRSALQKPKVMKIFAAR